MAIHIRDDTSLWPTYDPLAQQASAHSGFSPFKAHGPQIRISRFVTGSTHTHARMGGLVASKAQGHGGHPGSVLDPDTP